MPRNNSKAVVVAGPRPMTRRGRRNLTRSNNAGSIDAGLRTTLVTGPADPVQTTPDLIITKRVFNTAQRGIRSRYPLQPSTIGPAILGTRTGYLIRFIKLSFMEVKWMKMLV